MTRRTVVALLSGGLAGFRATAQQAVQNTAPPAAPQAPEEILPGTVIRVQAAEVIVPVTATNDKGLYVSNLERKDFRILDEGKPQTISFFSHDQRQPIVVGFLIDLSNASRIHWKTYQDAIEEMVFQLLPGDDPRYSGYLVSYGNDAEMAVNTTQDADKIVSAVRRMQPGGGAAFYDAVYKACTDRSLIQGEPYQPRRIIVVVGDGHDSSSKKTLAEVLELAKRNLVTVFAMSTQSFGFDNETEDVLERITSETGGHVEYPLNSLYKDVSGYLSHPTDAGNYVYEAGTGGYASAIAGGITAAIQGIAGDIATQYVLRYTPGPYTEPAGKTKVFRHIKVETPEIPSIKIRARDGYYPAEASSAPASH